MSVRCSSPAATRRWLGIKLDQRDLLALRAAAVRGEREFGGVDILFANAGIQSFHPLLEMEDADWHITIDVFGPSRLIW